MKFVNNNISPLPFYDSPERWNHMRGCAFGQVYCLAVEAGRLMPFQISLPELSEVSKIELIDFLSGTSKDVTLSMQQTGLNIIRRKGYSILMYKALFPIPELSAEGRHYLRITVAGLEHPIVSEIFTNTNNISGFVRIRYSNPFNFITKVGEICFDDNFYFEVLLKTEIGKPSYDFVEEATERMGYNFVESQVSKKTYRFTAVVPEYLCDALRVVRLCQEKTISDDVNTYDLTAFSMEIDWEEQGDLAAAKCEFETDTVIATVGNYKPINLGGDFNSDFSNDFLIE